MKIAIIGAGLSGANSFSFFKKNGYDVTIFEKSRGSGGRCSTRYINEKFIDHGTPFFEATDDFFVKFCERKIQENILIKKENYYYPTKGMNKLCSSLIDEENFIKNTKIVSCDFSSNKWELKDENGTSYKNFDILIITIPAPQILQLEIKIDDTIREKLESVQYDSIGSLMVYSNTYNNIMNPKLIADKSFKKIINNSSKYDYQNFSSYVIHLNTQLSNQQNFQTKEDVQNFIVKKVYEISKIDLNKDFHISPHLWRYAFVSKSLDEEYIYDQNLSLGFCGDYFYGDNLQSSYLSSKRLAKNITQAKDL